MARQIVIYLALFIFGFAASIAVEKFTRSDPYDLQVYRTSAGEVWISTDIEYSFVPMSSFRYIVRYREICKESGNFCSKWKIVSEFLMDDPTRAKEWKLSGAEGELRIEFAQNIVVRQAGDVWLTETIK